MNDESFTDGWYLMSLTQLEAYLGAWRAGDPSLIPEDVEKLSVGDAIAFRNRGNAPDDLDRSLRLVLRIDNEEDLRSLDLRRIGFEPDAHDAPAWRREGSRPINVVPLRRADLTGTTSHPWWEDPEMAAMEREWQESGTVDGLKIPGDLRGFVYKTIAALRKTETEVTPDAIADSVARWLEAEDVDELRAALKDVNQ
jgi:hypothetical protein